MPNYYTSPLYPTYPVSYNTYPTQPIAQPQQPQYMISVDGEMSARAWQIPANVGPNTIIPLFDFDGQHVYFKSTDQFGRQNPLRKGRIVFEEEQQQSEAAAPITMPDMSQYATKNDLEKVKEELIQNMKQTPTQQYNRNNQNGSNNRG